ncbi:hypothetical protein BDZ94DRAFT_1263329 [Collybia nuda]|uniref:F-box domain-containing protein n=1 Tax=Collybia nuda TaxID=64659 RepID=A0A9P5Y1E6_9AGAR|nr:hypothetical protein BDZ94DRAFT_1263329 [Collybia nuda]
MKAGKGLEAEALHNVDRPRIKGVNIESRLDDVVELQRSQGPVSPQECLPPEILGNAFLYCLDGQPVPVPPRSPVSMPWVLGHVCTRWRDVCLAEPGIWENISLQSVQFYPALAMEEALRRNRSKNIRLCPIPYWFSQDILPTLQLNCETIKSIENFRVTWKSTDFLSLIPSFTNLEYLGISFLYQLSPTSHFPGFSASPALREIALLPSACILRGRLIDSKDTMWDRLTSLHLAPSFRLPPSTILTILRRCKVLAHLSVGLGSEISNAEMAHAVCPAIQSIRVVSQYSTPGIFFSYITLPSLRSFEIDRGEWQVWPQQEILSFLCRSSCPLTKLHVRFRIPVECVVPILRTLPMQTVEDFAVVTDRALADEDAGVIVYDNLFPRVTCLSCSFSSSVVALRLLKFSWSRNRSTGIQSGKIKIALSDGVAGEEELGVLQQNIFQMGIDVIVSAL